MKFKIFENEKARELVDKMGVRELIKQVLCPSNGMIEDISDFGAMFFHPEDKDSVQKKITEFIDKCNIPPLIVSDMECGPGSAVKGTTAFPSMLGCSQANSTELAYEMGKIAAIEAGAIGYNWTLAPVADLLLEKDSPVVSTRSAGYNPDHNIKILGSYIRGLQDNGMAATIKHFPGDGTDIYDQHLTTPENKLDLATWRATQGRVFKELIDQGVHFVMPGHISFPAYDEKDSILDLYPPASISSRLLTDLLRGELGFEGLIVSDAINMGGVVGFVNYFEACARFFESGGDILLFSKTNELFFVEMEKLIEKGTLKLSTLRNRATRIISYKLQMNMFETNKKILPSYDKSYAEKISNVMVDKSATLVRDRNNLIPYKINNATRILHLVIMNDFDQPRDTTDLLFKEIQKYSDYVTQLTDPGPDVLFNIMYNKEYDLVICSVGCEASWGLNVARLHDQKARNMMGGWTKLSVPIVFIAHFHPFFHKEYEASADTVINTYGDTEYSANRVMKGILGDVPFNKTLLTHD